jgi:hypothetical protein
VRSRRYCARKALGPCGQNKLQENPPRRIEPGTPIYVWPYVPTIPDGLSAEEARRLYLETSGAPISRGQARELVARAVRSHPVGGFAELLPPVHLALVAEAKSKQRR